MNWKPLKKFEDWNVVFIGFVAIFMLFLGIIVGNYSTKPSYEEIFSIKDDLCKAQGFGYFEEYKSIDGKKFDSCCIKNCGGISCESFSISRKQEMDRGRLGCGGVGLPIENYSLVENNGENGK